MRQNFKTMMQAFIFSALALGAMGYAGMQGINKNLCSQITDFSPAQQKTMALTAQDCQLMGYSTEQ